MTQTPINTRGTDYGYYAIIGLVSLVIFWLLLMPVIPAIARTTLNRFHLRTGSFICWAMQQPIPAMYNFANQYEAIRTSGPQGTKTDVVLEAGYINHFPVRVITFANGRYRLLHDDRATQLTVQSSYRGQHLQTVFQLTQQESGATSLEIKEPVVDEPNGSGL